MIDEKNLMDGDAFFIGYCESHSETARALFHKDDVNRILSLAGPPPPYLSQVDPSAGDWISVPNDLMIPLVVAARDKLAASKQTT